MKRFVAAAVAAKMSYAGLFQFRRMPLSSIRVVFLRLFDGWRQGSVATSMRRSDVSSSNARAARFRTVAGSPSRAFDAARARRWLGARAGKRARATARFAVAGLLESARVPRAVGLPGAAGVLVALLSGCALGPDYVRPEPDRVGRFRRRGREEQGLQGKKGLEAHRRRRTSPIAAPGGRFIANRSWTDWSPRSKSRIRPWRPPKPITDRRRS